MIKPIFSKKGGYLEELADLENYVGVTRLRQELKDGGFTIIKEVRLAVDNIYDTVGLLTMKNP